jgi:hypothetical protein
MLLGILLILVGAGLMVWAIAKPVSEYAAVNIRLAPRQELNDLVIKVASGYPTDGSMKSLRSHDPEFSGYGVTTDVLYAGRLVAKARPGGRSHCIGFVFEVFMQALDRHQRHTGRPVALFERSPDLLRRFQQEFYGTDGSIGTFVDALIRYNLGHEIRDISHAKRGDLVQFWYRAGYGHAGIIWDLIRNSAGEVCGIRFLQSGHGSIHFEEQDLSTTTSAVAQMFVVRPMAP